MLQTREIALNKWLAKQFDVRDIELKPLSGDAGFRRYFRFLQGGVSYIAVDSPPAYCNNQAFIDIQAQMKLAGVVVPEIKSVDISEGFFCLSDLGNTLLSDKLSHGDIDNHYTQAMALIPRMAALSTDTLPCFDDDFVQMELDIFTEWLLDKHLLIRLSEVEQQKLQQCFDVLIENIRQQPKVFMHRDFHSRNLMWSEQGLAVIDFQDAVKGPLTYDIVSLLRDCYVRWPNEQILALFRQFIENYENQLAPSNIDKQTWLRWFDLTGVQRHVKAAGIFARLLHRDGKAGYIKDIPLTLSYIVDICDNYPELEYLQCLIKGKVLPALDKRTTIS